MENKFDEVIDLKLLFMIYRETVWDRLLLQFLIKCLRDIEQICLVVGQVCDTHSITICITPPIINQRMVVKMIFLQTFAMKKKKKMCWKICSAFLFLEKSAYMLVKYNIS